MSRLRSASRSDRSCSPSVSPIPLPSLRDCASAAASSSSASMSDAAATSRSAAYRSVPVPYAATALRIWRASRFAARGRLVERIGHVRHRVLEAVLGGQRPDEREEVRELACDLGLPRLGARAPRYSVGNTYPTNAIGSATSRAAGEQRGEREADREDGGSEHELGGVDLGGREDLRVEPGPDEVALAHLGRERGRPGGEARGDGARIRSQSGWSSDTRRSYRWRGSRDRADRVESPRRAGATRRTPPCTGRTPRGRPLPFPRAPSPYASSRVTRQDRTMPVTSSSAAAGRRT